jgi:hypothetical protein
MGRGYGILIGTPIRGPALRRRGLEAAGPAGPPLGSAVVAARAGSGGGGAGFSLPGAGLLPPGAGEAEGETEGE